MPDQSSLPSSDAHDVLRTLAQDLLSTTSSTNTDDEIDRIEATLNKKKEKDTPSPKKIEQKEGEQNNEEPLPKTPPQTDKENVADEKNESDSNKTIEKDAEVLKKPLPQEPPETIAVNSITSSTDSQADSNNSDPVVQLEKERAQLVLKRHELEVSEKKPLEEIEKIDTQLHEEKTKLEPFVTQEREFDQKISTLHERELQQTNLDNIKQLQQERWKHEDARTHVEQQKWVISQRCETLIAEKTLKIQEVEAIKRQGDVVDQKITSIDREIQRIKIQRELDLLHTQKENIENDWIAKNEEKTKLESERLIVENDIRITSDERRALEQQEQSTDSTKEEREIEKLRQDSERRLRTSEQKRWDILSKLKDLERSIELLKPTYQQAVAREEAMKQLLNSLS